MSRAELPAHRPATAGVNTSALLGLVAALKIPAVRVDGFEADDVMGTLAVKGARKMCSEPIWSWPSCRAQLADALSASTAFFC